MNDTHRMIRKSMDYWTEVYSRTGSETALKQYQQCLRFLLYHLHMREKAG